MTTPQPAAAPPLTGEQVPPHRADLARTEEIRHIATIIAEYENLSAEAAEAIATQILGPAPSPPNLDGIERADLGIEPSEWVGPGADDWIQPGPDGQEQPPAGQIIPATATATTDLDRAQVLLDAIRLTRVDLDDAMASPEGDPAKMTADEAETSLGQLHTELAEILDANPHRDFGPVRRAQGFYLTPPKAGEAAVLEPTDYVVIDNPDDPLGPPLYEGLAAEANRALEPGTYIAQTDSDTVPLTVTEQPASVDASERPIPGRPSGTITRSSQLITGGADGEAVLHAIADDLARTSTTNTPAPAPAGPLMHHGPAGTTITGTTKTNTVMRAALKDVGFKWSSRQGFWYLPRNWKPGTRDQAVKDLRGQLALSGQVLPTTSNDHDRCTESATGAPNRAAAPAEHSRESSFAWDDRCPTPVTGRSR